MKDNSVRYFTAIQERHLPRLRTLYLTFLAISIVSTISFPHRLLPSHCLANSPSSLADFDEYAQTALTDWQIPGMVVAIVKDGEVVLARGYGYRKVQSDNPVNTH